MPRSMAARSRKLSRSYVMPAAGFPRKRDREKWLVIGRGIGGRLVEIVYLLDDDGTAFVIHAMPLTTRRRRG